MEFLKKTFLKPDPTEFPGVLVPLSQAPRKPSIISTVGADPERQGSDSPPGYEPGAGNNKEKDGRKSSGSIGHDAYTIEGLKAEVESDVAASGHDTAYDRKSKVINKAIQDMGMGRYQWELFVLCGFGWFADNFWLQGVALVLPQLTPEFGITSTHARFTTLSLFLGLCLGASFWGTASDVVGRRLAFNTTLFIGGVFGTAAGGGQSWIAVCALLACMGVGVGGNLPVDGALFLEFLPFASGNLLTLLSIWWPVGALLASMIAWGLIGTSFSCDTNLLPCGANAAPCCQSSDNMGWRYFLFTLGAITILQWAARFFLFHLYESPKFLLSRGRQREAVAVIHGIAYHNKTKTWLTEEILNEIGGDPEVVSDAKLSTSEIIKRSLNKFSVERIGPLFGSRKLGLNTALLWFMWATIGMGYPLFNAFLPQYIASSGGSTAVNSTYITYRNYAITTVVGVPGSALAYYTVNLKYIGRKGTMAISTVITGVFVFLFTASSNPDFQLAFSSLEAFFQNIMYGVLYAYTPEVFPAPNRGTGTGVASFLNRIGGMMAPIVAIYGSSGNPKAPIYASGALFFAAFIAMLVLPIETRGKQSL